MTTRLIPAGYRGTDELGRHQCLTCWGWRHPAIHSCPGVPQPGRTPPPTPQGIQRLRTRGWRMPPDAMYVGRPGPFGNPFTIEGCIDVGYATNREDAAMQCVRAFRSWVNVTGAHRFDSDVMWSGDGTRSYDRRVIRARLHELTGRDLACWCALDRPCHRTVLLELANPAALVGVS